MAIRSDVFMPLLPEIRKPTTAKCPCCGSRQFAAHQSRRICTYCRSEQDGQPVAAKSLASTATTTQLLSDKLEFLRGVNDAYAARYGQTVLRPEVCVRIPEL